MNNRYETPPKSFENLIEPFEKEIQQICNSLRSVIRSSLPEASEGIYGGKKFGNALYSVGESTNVICGLQPDDNFVRLFFHNWKGIQEAGIKLEGTGKNARHQKFKTLDEIETAEVEKMISIASEGKS